MTAPRSGLVAVLFTDLVGSTELMSQLGDRAFDELRRRHFAALSKAVTAHLGEEVKNTGDGLMAVFPSAAEAVEAAVAMQQATARQAKKSPLAIRIGVAVGDATAEGGDYFGTPVVEAARLVAAARPGQILTTQIARALAGARCTAAFTDLGPLELKGLPEPVAVCEVGWQPSVSVVPMPALLTDVGRVFVGRDGEVERLHQLWKEAAAGERRVALLGGEPGIGKTRLAVELARRLHEEGALILAGRCDEDLGVPFQPFVEALQHYAAHVSELRLGRYGEELARLVPELSSKAPGLPEPLRSDPETERYRLFDAVAAWLTDISTDDPVLLVLDDVHWAAKPTLLLLRHVLRSAEPLRLLVVATYRDSEVGRGHPLAELLADLRRVEGVERFPLTGLDQAGVAAFIEAAAGHALAEDDEGLPGAVWAETEGNPFFVVEVLRHLAETGGVEQRDGRWVMTAPVDQLGIPEGVREVVGRRLSRLSEAANRALWVASIVGLEFDPAVVRMAGDLSDEALFSSLEEAVGTRLVSEVGTRYRFSHALVRATLYDEMTAARRVALHRKVAEAIETMHAGALDDDLPALAHHWARAGAPAAETARAVDYATRAGDRALAQLAHDEAVAYYRQALELLDVAEGTAGPARRLQLLIALGEAQRRAGDAGYRETLLAAAGLAEDQGDPEALTRAALANSRGMMQSSQTHVDRERVAALESALSAIGGADSLERARLLANLGLELTSSPERTRRLRLSDEALAMARRLGDAATIAQVLTARFFTVTSPDTLPARLTDTSELVRVSHHLGDPVATALAHLLRARARTESGDVTGAREDLQTTERIAAELGQPTLRWYTAWTRAAHRLLAGQLVEAEALALEAGRLGEATGQPDTHAFLAAQIMGIRLEQGRVEELVSVWRDLAERRPEAKFIRAVLALLHAETGNEEEAAVILDDLARSDFDTVLVNNTWVWAITSLCIVAARLGDEARCTTLRNLLTPYADQIAGLAPLWLGSMCYYLALLDTACGRFDEADRHFAVAEEMNERIDAPAWVARTRLEWARMLLTRRQGGDAERAQDLLGEALATARELGLANVERRAVELLR